MANDFEIIKKKLSTILRNAPKEIAVIAQQHFEESFDLGGYNETPFVKWQERKNPNSRRNRGRAILIESGRLSRSIRIKSVSKTRIVLTSDVPYAQIHNEGGTINQGARSELRARNRTSRGRFAKGFQDNTKGFTSKARTINIPKRQFMGENNRLLKQKIDNYFRNKIKNLI